MADNSIRLPEISGKKPHQRGIVFGPPTETPVVENKSKTRKRMGNSNKRNMYSSKMSTVQGSVGKSGYDFNAVDEEYTEENTYEDFDDSADTADLGPM